MPCLFCSARLPAISKVTVLEYLTAPCGTSGKSRILAGLRCARDALLGKRGHQPRLHDYFSLSRPWVGVEELSGRFNPPMEDEYQMNLNSCPNTETIGATANIANTEHLVMSKCDGGVTDTPGCPVNADDKYVDKRTDDEVLVAVLENAHSGRASSLWGRHDLDALVIDCIYRHESHKYGTYFEPFLGRAFAFWALAHDRRWDKAILGDSSEHIIRTYDLVRDSEDAIVSQLHLMPVTDRRKRPAFEPVGASDHILRVAQTVRLGAWNDMVKCKDKLSPSEFERRLRRLEEIRVSSCSGVLCNYPGISLEQSDFAHTLKTASSGDLAFLDPPRHFSLEEHKRLAKCFRDLCARSVLSIVVIPPSDEVSQLYEGFTIEQMIGPMPKPKRTRRKGQQVEPLQRPLLARVVVGGKR